MTENDPSVTGKPYSSQPNISRCQSLLGSCATCYADFSRASAYNGLHLERSPSDFVIDAKNLPSVEPTIRRFLSRFQCLVERSLPFSDSTTESLGKLVWQLRKRQSNDVMLNE